MTGAGRFDPAGRADPRGLDVAAVRAASRRMSRRDDAPWLHREVAQRLLSHLEPLRATPARVFDWWAGAGGIGAALKGRFPGAAIVPVEAGPEWTTGARAPKRRWWPGAAAAPARLDDEDDEALGTAGVVVANMALHGVADVPALFSRWHRLLEPDGIVAFSCLGPGTLPELRALYAEHGWGPPSPVFTDMHDLGDMLVGAGFAHPVLDQETIVLTWADAGSALAELRRVGGNAAPARFAGLRTPRWRRDLEAALATRADREGRIGLTFEVAYGHGFRAGPRAAPGAPATVPLETVRAQLRRRR